MVADAARAAPYEKGTETAGQRAELAVADSAAWAGPYEKGSDTHWHCDPAARRPLRGGLTPSVTSILRRAVVAARAATYEKATETNDGTPLTYSLSGRAR